MKSRRSQTNHRPEPAGMDETRVFQASEVRRPRKRTARTVGFVILAILLFAVGAAAGFYRYISASSGDELIPPEYLETYQGRINILVMGIDAGVNGQLLNPQADRTGTRSDVNMLVSFDPEIKEAGVVLIPRDTRVYIPEEVFGYEKMAHAHAYGGPSLAVKTVENFLDVPVHYYVRVDFEAFKKAVDTLGGVDFVIPEDMDYDDPFQDLHIHLKQGPATLDGEHALQLVRYRRYTNGDIGRIATQEAFLKAMLDKVVSLSGVIKIPELVQELSPYVKTDLSTEDILNLATMAAGMSTDDVKMGMVPGVDRYIDDGQGELSYWIADREATAGMVDELIRGISKERNATIRVAVQNGNGVVGSADKLATELRYQGFNVVSVGNASKQDYVETRIIASADKRSSQYLVLNCLKDLCPGAKSVVDKVPAGADVLIIVGMDAT